jgi:hypothetical protein
MMLARLDRFFIMEADYLNFEPYYIKLSSAGPCPLAAAGVLG